MKLISILFITALLLSCGTTKETSSNVETTKTATKPERNIMLKAETGAFTDSEPFDILAVRREGNTLFVEISFVGGCGVHNFKVIGNKATMKSLPAKRSFIIAHEVPREECKEPVKKMLEIDITELAESQTPGSEINLILQGWEEEINYIFE